MTGKFGPSNIGACLQELDKVGARATLFVMSRELDSHPPEVRDELVAAVARGFELGNHDVNDVKTVLRSREDFIEVTRECDDVSLERSIRATARACLFSLSSVFLS